MNRPYNFGAGPAMLPEAVLVKAQQELLNWQGQGMSVMEISHRSQPFQDMLAEATQRLRTLLSVPDDFEILFLSGPAREQYAMIPMNLLGEKQKADYIDSGIWSKMAFDEATRYGDIKLASSSEANRYTTIEPSNRWQVRSDAEYLFFVDNETINGVEFAATPEVNVPLVSDMTSNFLSRPIDFNRYAAVFAGAQKNIGPAALTIVIIKKQLLGKAQAITPTVFDYKVQADNQSLYYTPAAFACYIANLTFAWVEEQGGVDAMHQQSLAKAEKLYAYIDSEAFYQNPIDKAVRSRINIPFTLADSALDAEFLAKAKQHDLLALKGHRFVGGMRASLYNAMPEAGVDALIDFMRNFAKQHG